MKENPLVSIGVVTYNAEEFIQETLDSIFNQTYKNIELIVADDNSTDKTVELARKWFERKGCRFNGYKLLTSSSNTGVSGNSNRALRAANGEWYKCFDGDDLMTPNAITDYVDYVNKYPQVEMVMANVCAYSCKGVVQLLPIPLMKLFFSEKCTATKQASIISKRIIGYSQGFFVKTSVIKEEGGFDERFPYIEDYPLFIKLINKGHKMFFMNEITAEYRTVDTSISRSKQDSSIFSNSIVRCTKEYRYNYQREYLSPLWKRLLDFSIFLKCRIIDSGNTYASFKCRLYYRMFKILDPFFFYRKYTNLLNLFS